MKIKHNIELPETDIIYLLGKGPSLETFMKTYDGQVLLGINETGYLYKCWAAYGADEVIRKKYMQHLPAETVMICRADHKERHPKMIRYRKGVTKPPCGNSGSAGIALQILYYLGYRRFRMAGFDGRWGEPGYANDIVKHGVEGRNRSGYKRIHKALDKVIKQLEGVHIEWLHPQAGWLSHMSQAERTTRTKYNT